jgi:hypothetical protein
MYQISTMNLSMAVLNSWRTRSRLPSNAGDADSKVTNKRDEDFSMQTITLLQVHLIFLIYSVDIKLSVLILGMSLWKCLQVHS